MAFQIADYDSIHVGNRRLPGKFINVMCGYNSGPFYIFTMADYIYWTDKIAMGGMIHFLGWDLCWGCSANEADDMNTVFKFGRVLLRKPLSAEEQEEYESCLQAEARQDAWLEMRAEQGWYDG